MWVRKGKEIWNMDKIQNISLAIDEVKTDDGEIGAYVARVFFWYNLPTGEYEVFAVKSFPTKEEAHDWGLAMLNKLQRMLGAEIFPD